VEKVIFLTDLNHGILSQHWVSTMSTDTKLRNIMPLGKLYKIHDHDCLYVAVTVPRAISFRDRALRMTK